MADARQGWGEEVQEGPEHLGPRREEVLCQSVARAS